MDKLYMTSMIGGKVRIKDIKKGDLITYRNGKTNNVNNPYNYMIYFNDNFKSNKNANFDIMKIQRYTKLIYFYKLKTIYKRKEN